MANLILYSLLAGVVGTGIGGFIAIFIKRSNKMLMTYLLNFAGGMMISITCFKLIPESVELSNIYLTTVGIFIGILFIQLFNFYLDRIQSKKKCVEPHVQIEELIHSEGLIKEIKHSQVHQSHGETSDARIFKAGIIMLVAIALHNFPEGLAIGSTGAYNAQIGLVLAFTIAFHNIPEGMAIAVPLSCGGMNKYRALWLTALSGFPTVIGAIIGFAIGGISNAVAAFALSLASGAMIYVTFGEIMPQAILMCHNKKSVVYMLMGFIIGMIVMYLT